MAEAATVAARRTWTAITVHAGMLIWAAGLALHERLAQLGALVVALVSVIVIRHTWRQLDPDVRRLCILGATLIGWQVVSPFVAAPFSEHPVIQDSGRYFQVFEPLGTLVIAVVGPLGIPLLQMALALAAGWIASAALAIFQHFYAWPFENPRVLKIPAARVRENFAESGPPRYGGGGFFFHRLRFAHAGLAFLGPAIAWASRADARLRARIVAAALIVALFAGISVTYTRAALGTALLVTAAAALVLLKGKLRWAAIGAGALLVIAVVAAPGWLARAGRAAENLFAGERMQAMTAGARIFLEHPVVGVGYSNHRGYALDLAPELGMPLHVAHDSHNLWITTAAETGVVGLLLLLAFHVLLARALWTRHRSGDPLASGALLSFGAFHVLGLVHYLPFHSNVAQAFYFVFGLALVPISARQTRASSARS